MLDWNKHGPRLYAALKALSENEHADLEGLVYTIRDREGEGWDGRSVTQWGTAVGEMKYAIADAEADGAGQA